MATESKTKTRVVFFPVNLASVFFNPKSFKLNPNKLYRVNGIRTNTINFFVKMKMLADRGSFSHI